MLEILCKKMGIYKTLLNILMSLLQKQSSIGGFQTSSISSEKVIRLVVFPEEVKKLGKIKIL